MKIFPAIDLQAQQVVRLLRGEFDQKTVYSQDPMQVARGFAAQGAHNLHVVDLDGARTGEAHNSAIIADLAKNSGLFVEVGGGIRTPERVAQYLEMGVGRVILGTAALENPAFLQAMVRQWGARIAVGVDARDGMVATHGWLTQSTVQGPAFCQSLRDMGVQTVIYTDISRDGAMQGTNLPLYEQLSTICGLDIIASGGISTIAEVLTLRDMGLYGAILGKSLYTGAIDLAQAVQLAEVEVC